MRNLLVSFLFGFAYLFPLSSHSQSTISNTSTIHIYTSKLFERQLIQYAYGDSPNPKTGIFSGIVTNYNLDNEWGFANFRLNTFSSPKPSIYSFILLSTSELIDNPIFHKKFRDDLLKIWIKFSNTYRKDKNQKININDRNQYVKLLDSLDSKINPYYSLIDSVGARILDSIQSNYSFVTLSKTQIVRNNKVSKLEANKFWETSFSLFDAYDDKLITLESPSRPVYNLFIYNETDNIDSLINLRHSDIENGYSAEYRNWYYSPNRLSTNNGLKFKNFDNFYKWAKIKYPEKFINTQVVKSQVSNQNVKDDFFDEFFGEKSAPKSSPTKIVEKSTSTEQTKNEEPSEYKNLSAFLKLLASSSSNTSSTSNSKSESNSSNYTRNCSECEGTGKCRDCSQIFRTYYWDGRYRGWKNGNETRPGQVMCSVCKGAGVTYGSSGISRPEGPETKKCYVAVCKNGWIYCRKCNYEGNGKQLGVCKRCKGSGSK